MSQRIAKPVLAASLGLFTILVAKGDNFSVSAAVSTAVHQGSNFSASGIRIENGIITYSNPGSGSTLGTSPVGPGATAVSALATQPGSNPISVTTTASANLSFGRLRASVTSTGGVTPFGTPGGLGRSEFSDIVTFTNSNLTDVFLPFSWSTDGSIDTPYDPNSVFVFSQIVFTNVSGSARLRGGILDGLRSTFHSDGSITNQSVYSGPPLPYGAGSTWTTTNTSAGTTMGVVVQSELFIPTGVHQLLIHGVLEADCGAGSTCNFGNTAQFGFGKNPSGLTWTSSSGVFLSGLATPPPSAVPEPGTFALMGLGAAVFVIGRTCRQRE